MDSDIAECSRTAEHASRHGHVRPGERPVHDELSTGHPGRACEGPGVCGQDRRAGDLIDPAVADHGRRKGVACAGVIEDDPAISRTELDDRRRHRPRRRGRIARGRTDIEGARRLGIDGNGDAACRGECPAVAKRHDAAAEVADRDDVAAGPVRTGAIDRHSTGRTFTRRYPSDATDHGGAVANIERTVAGPSDLERLRHKQGRPRSVDGHDAGGDFLIGDREIGAGRHGSAVDDRQGAAGGAGDNQAGVNVPARRVDGHRSD